MASFRSYFLPKKRDWNEDEDDSEVENESDDKYLECKDILNTTSRKYQFYRPSMTPEKQKKNLKNCMASFCQREKILCVPDLIECFYVPSMDGWDDSE